MYLYFFISNIFGYDSINQLHVKTLVTASISVILTNEQVHFSLVGLLLIARVNKYIYAYSQK